VSSTHAPTATRRSVLELLKWHGPMTAASLGAQLGVSVVAVRRHLEGLERDGLVCQGPRAGGRGRPAHVYQLSEAGHEQFPRNYDQLVGHLLEAAAAEFGADAVQRLFAHRRRLLAGQLSDEVPAGATLAEVAACLASIQDAGGYMAEAVPHAGADDAFVLREHNCAIPAVAADHPVACLAELALLRDLAGPGVQVERIAHMRQGDHVCAYLLRAASAAPSGPPGPGDQR
jgi:predicted ArsR family transcriptional regulator